MHIDYATLETCAAATKSVVVVDVWRSFTTAAYAFAAGVRDILVVASAEEALALRLRYPRAMIMGMGELGGKPADGFDYGNSPSELRACDLRDRCVILSTPNGTPGLVRCVNAGTLVAGSLVCARATVNYLKRQAPEGVTFVCTETGIADQACAEYMAALLRHDAPDSVEMLDKIRVAWLEQASNMIARGLLTEAKINKLEMDLNCCLALDEFDFVMVVHRRDGLLVMEAVAEQCS